MLNKITKENGVCGKILSIMKVLIYIKTHFVEIYIVIPKHSFLLY